MAEDKQQPRIVLFDIEATNLDADFGYVLCFGYAALSGQVPLQEAVHSAKVLTISQFPGRHVTDDSRLMAKAWEIIESADILVTYYGKEFDYRFVNSRMLRAGLKPLPPLGASHIDLYYTAKRNFKLHSGRMGALAEYFGCPFKKTSVSGPTWVEAMAGDKKAIEYVAKHCLIDVKMLTWLYYKLRPMVRQHPHLSVLQGNVAVDRCPVCSSRMQRRGRTVRGATIVQRLWCRRCGRWEYPALKHIASE